LTSKGSSLLHQILGLNNRMAIGISIYIYIAKCDESMAPQVDPPIVFEKK
jgi:hypothetical protein